MTFIPSKTVTTLQQGFKASERYTFDASIKKVVVEDEDFKSVISVYNVTLGVYLYLIGDNSYNGSTENNAVFYNNTVANVSDSDELYIIYEALEKEDISGLIYQLIQQQKKTNKILTKIYQ